MKYLNGSDLAGFIKQRQVHAVRPLKQSYNTIPKLAIVQLKDDPVIDTYVRLKKAYGLDVDIEVDVHRIAQSEARGVIKALNEDPAVHGIILQLPIEDPSETDELCNLVSPDKDVDGLGDPTAPWPTHLDAGQGVDEQRTESYRKYDEGVAETTTQSSAKTTSGVSSSARKQAGGVRGSWFEPATPMAILWLLAGYNVELRGKKIVLVGNGKLVGKPLAKNLASSGYDIVVADRSTQDLKDICLQADIIITATGSPAIIYAEMLKLGAIVVDAGVASEEGKIVGDLASDVYGRDDLTLTPVKGGVGPLTICALFENVIISAQKSV